MMRIQEIEVRGGVVERSKMGKAGKGGERKSGVGKGCEERLGL